MRLRPTTGQVLPTGASGPFYVGEELGKPLVSAQACSRGLSSYERAKKGGIGVVQQRLPLQRFRDLQDIPGVGAKSYETLFRHYYSAARHMDICGIGASAPETHQRPLF